MGDIVHFPTPSHARVSNRATARRVQVWYSLEADRLILVSVGRLSPLLFIFIGIL